jgi:Thoeris protein ThsB, TIR-like domain
VSDPRAFVSFDFDHDETSKYLFVGQTKKDSPTPFTVADWSSKSALPERHWEVLIKSKINRCHLMIVLVGRYMATATGVRREIQFAKDGNVPYFGVYVNGANSSSALPTGLVRNRVISWTWPGIARVVSQMMTEGKNAS